MDSILKSRDISLTAKVRLVKAMVFPVVMYRCDSWTINRAECWRIDAFELWCWRRLLRVPWTARRSNQSILKKISLECSLEGLIWSWNSNTLTTWCKEPTCWKRSWYWKDWRWEEKGTTEDDMALPTQWTWVWVCSGSWWWTEGPVCCSPWGHKDLDTTEWLNWLVDALIKKPVCCYS